jgi:hypothetical protein
MTRKCHIESSMIITSIFPITMNKCWILLETLLAGMDGNVHLTFHEHAQLNRPGAFSFVSFFSSLGILYFFLYFMCYIQSPMITTVHVWTQLHMFPKFYNSKLKCWSLLSIVSSCKNQWYISIGNMPLVSVKFMFLLFSIFYLKQIVRNLIIPLTPGSFYRRGMTRSRCPYYIARLIKLI